MGFLARIIFLVILINESFTTKVIPESVLVAEGEGFIIRLENFEGPNISACELSRHNNRYILRKSQPVHLPSGEVVHPFENNTPQECGGRVLNTTKASQGTWNLTAFYYESEERITVSLQVNITAPAHVETIHDRLCDHKQCENVSHEKTSKITDPVKPSLERKKNWILSCESKGFYEFNECVVEHPTNQLRFSFRANLPNQLNDFQDNRYSLYITNKKRCQFEIPPDVLDTEVGVWRIHLYTWLTSTTCHFLVDDPSGKALQRLKQRTESPVVIKTNNMKHTVDCVKNPPYALRLCYLVTSSGLTFGKNTDLNLGKCSFVVSPGNWTCGFNGPTEEDEDFSQRFQVIHYTTEAIDEKVTEGDVTLECHQINESPIDMCLFVSPSGKIFRPLSSSFSSTSFSFYKGGTMEKGNCGITLRGKAAEKGEWMCSLRVKDGRTSSTKIRY